MHWLGPIPRTRDERHFGARVVRCFAERPAHMAAMLAEAVLRNPDGEALICASDRLTYLALEERVSRLAGGLEERGVKRGERVAILLANSAELVIAFHAIVRLGAIAVLLNIREERPELAFILGNCRASAIIHGAALAARVPDAEQCPELRLRIAVGGEAPGSISLDAVGTGPSRPAVEIAEEDVAAILYTSGTTGRPKGAMLTHLGIVHAAMIYETCMGLTQRDRSIVSVPLSHVTGLTAGIAVMLRVAGTLVIMPAFKAGDFIQLAAAERMTHTVMVPAMYNLCLLDPGFARADLSAWRIGGYGGAPMPEVTIRRLAEQLPNLKLMNAYGSTETTGPVVLMPPSESLARRTAVGRAVPVTDLRVMDEQGREAAPGQTGEIWLRAPNVVAGYWNNSQATAESFVAGYWRSGDLGSMDEAGYVSLHDRVKDMINRGGFKIYSVEVENCLAAHPEIIEAAVVARSCPVLGERVHAFVVPKDAPLAIAELRAHCTGRLADYKIPETVTMLDEPLPRNAAGKVMKRQLRERLPG